MNKLYQLFNSLTGTNLKKKLPDDFMDIELAEAFHDFFRNKIMGIISGFANQHVLPVAYVDVDYRLHCLKTIEKNDFVQVIKKAKKTHCAKDPIPISEIVDTDHFSCSIDIFLMIINTSISTFKFPEPVKLPIIKPILKAKLDHQNLSS